MRMRWPLDNATAELSLRGEGGRANPDRLGGHRRRATGVVRSRSRSGRAARSVPARGRAAARARRSARGCGYPGRRRARRRAGDYRRRWCGRRRCARRPRSDARAGGDALAALAADPAEPVARAAREIQETQRQAARTAEAGRKPRPRRRPQPRAHRNGHGHLCRGRLSSDRADPATAAAESPRRREGAAALVGDAARDGGVDGRGATLMRNLGLIGGQGLNDLTPQLLLGSAGAIIGFGTSWGLSRFGFRPTVEQAAWFANSTAWGTLAGLTAWSASGSTNPKLQYGALVLGEAAGLGLGAWSAYKWRWTGPRWARRQPGARDRPGVGRHPADSGRDAADRGQGRDRTSPGHDRGGNRGPRDEPDRQRSPTDDVRRARRRVDREALGRGRDLDRFSRRPPVARRRHVGRGRRVPRGCGLGGFAETDGRRLAVASGGLLPATCSVSASPCPTPGLPRQPAGRDIFSRGAQPLGARRRAGGRRALGGRVRLRAAVAARPERDRDDHRGRALRGRRLVARARGRVPRGAHGHRRCEAPRWVADRRGAGRHRRVGVVAFGFAPDEAAQATAAGAQRWGWRVGSASRGWRRAIPAARISSGSRSAPVSGSQAARSPLTTPACAHPTSGRAWPGSASVRWSELSCPHWATMSGTTVAGRTAAPGSASRSEALARRPRRTSPTPPPARWPSRSEARAWASSRGSASACYCRATSVPAPRSRPASAPWLVPSAARRSACSSTGSCACPRVSATAPSRSDCGAARSGSSTVCCSPPLSILQD